MKFQELAQAGTVDERIRVEAQGISKRGIPKNLKETADGFADVARTFMMRKFLLLIAFVAPIAAHANPAFRAFDATPIFGDSREVIRENNNFSYRFTYRGGTVTYRPKMGAEWKKDGAAASDSVAGVKGVNRNYPVFPNGCMVFACARAEEMRRNPALGIRSQVIGYKRADESGHAFVVYEKGGRWFAEDDRGYKLSMPAWKNRTPEQALDIAKRFQSQTHPASSAAPVRASFIGVF